MVVKWLNDRLNGRERQAQVRCPKMSPLFSVVTSHLPAHIVFLLLSAIVDVNDVKEEVGTLEHLLQWMRGG